MAGRTSFVYCILEQYPEDKNLIDSFFEDF
jgi:hypothetical protein